MKRIILAFLLLVAGLHADMPFVTGIEGFGAGRNNYTGNIGNYLTNTTGQTITITQLGRWVRSGNNLTHTLAIRSYATPTVLLASVVIDCSGATPDEFLYGTLSTPFEWAVGQSIFIVSSETNGGDSWYDGTNTGIEIEDIAVVQSAFVSSTTGNAFIGGNNGYTWTSVGPVSFQYSSPTKNWTKLGSVYTLDDCELYTLNSAINDADPGDEINGPAGTATWGVSGYGANINKGVKVRYAGSGSTTINIPSTAPTYSSGGTVSISGSNASFGGVRFEQSGSANTTAIHVTGANFRVTDVIYDDNYPGTGGWNEGYFVYASSYGLIDNCALIVGYGQAEPLYTRGPSNSWKTAGSLGTADAVYFEDCTWDGNGYTDFNANARGVVRFNTFNETSKKLDVHGYSTNSPKYSGRSLEAYFNTFTGTTGSYSAIEIRGGRPILFNNTSANNTAGFNLTDYGYTTNKTTWGFFQTPFNYPLFTQIGAGTLTSINATALVAGQRAEINVPGSTTWTAIGSANNTSGTQFTATGPGSGDGTAWISPATEPGYIFNNLQNGTTWERFSPSIGTASSWTTNTAGYSIGATSITLASRQVSGGGEGKIGVGDSVAFAGDTNGRYLVTASTLSGTPTSGTITIAAPGLLQALPTSGVVMTSGPLTSYQRQTGNLSATFTPRDIIQSNRDIYADAGFDTNTGVTTGPIGSIGSAVGKTGQGYWTTDTGTWNTQDSQVGTPGYQKGQGQLYVSNGVTWDLYYEPYTYPHPLQGAAPLLLSASVNAAGTQLTLVWSESCTTGAGGNGGVTITPSGGASTATYSSGSGSNTYTYNLSRTIGGIEALTTSYTQPGNGIEATTGGADVASYSGSSVTNNSTASGIINATTINVTNLVIGN